MRSNKNTIHKMANLIYTLRQKCALKDNYFVQTLKINSAEYNCLVHFFDEDSLSVKELATRLDITPGGVTRILTSLEEKGIIERQMSKEDRRGINVVLSEVGMEMVAEIRKASYEMHAEILSHIDTEHHELVLTAVEHLISAINKWVDAHNAKPKEL